VQDWLRATATSLHTDASRGTTLRQYLSAITAAKVKFPLKVSKRKSIVQLANDRNICVAAAALVDARIHAKEATAGIAGRLDCARVAPFTQQDVEHSLEYSILLQLDATVFNTPVQFAGWAHRHLSSSNRSPSTLATSSTPCSSTAARNGQCGSSDDDVEANGTCHCVQQGTGNKCKVGSGSCFSGYHPACGGNAPGCSCSCIKGIPAPETHKR
jgi:hypothetical protein